MVLKRFIPVALLLAAIPGVANAAELIVNGGFETGDYTGWQTSVQAGSSGNLSISTPGANSPISGFPTAANPAGGSFYSVTDQTGPGAYALTQAFTLASNTTTAILNFQMFVNNYAGSNIVNPAGLDFNTGPNEHARVDILTAGASAFSTSAADIVANFYLGSDALGVANPYAGYTFDLLSSGLVAGQSYQIRFAEVDNSGFFQQGVDNVSITTRESSVSAVPEPASWMMLILGFGLVGYAMRRRSTPSMVRLNALG